MADLSLALADAVRLRPPLGITCAGKTDGGGAQVQAQMSARLFALATGVPYLHTPMATVAHGTADDDWAAMWEQAFRVGLGQARVPEGARVVTAEEYLAGACDQQVVVGAPHFHGLADSDPDAYLPLIPELRDAVTFPLTREGGRPVLALHVRRGDVTPAARRRWTETHTLARSVECVRLARPDVEVHLVSQGRPEEFDGVEADVLHLDIDPIESISILSSADYLLTAKSSFSYVAGLLSGGTVLYEPFWHKPLSRWIVREDDGSLVLPPLARTARGLRRILRRR